MIIEEFAPETVYIQGKDNIIANYPSYWAKQESKEEEFMMITSTQSPYGLNIADHKFYELFAAEDAEDYEQDTCPVAYHTIPYH